MPRLRALAVRQGFVGRNGGPPLRCVASGMSRHDNVLRGAAKRVHARKGRARRVHGVHAPVPGTSCRVVDLVVATRFLPARADANGSPPSVAVHVAARALAARGARPARWNEWVRNFIKCQTRSNFWSRMFLQGDGTGAATVGSWPLSRFVQVLMNS